MGRAVVRRLFAGVVAGLLIATPSSAHGRTWKRYAYVDGAFALQPGASEASIPSSSTRESIPADIAPGGDVSASVLADVTGDGQAEWVVLLWRPWQDWPIREWHPGPSPIADFHDEAGNSCHLVLVSPADGREIWAGSALPVPLLALEVGDVDGDGRNEVVTLEGNYGDGRDGVAGRVDVWAWREFGFKLVWRSEQARIRELRLLGDPRTGILGIGVR